MHQARQEESTPFAGTEALSNPASMAPTITLQISQRTTQSSGSRPTGSTTYIPVGTSSVGPIPVMNVLVAIATICCPSIQPGFAVANASVVLDPSFLGSNTESKLSAAAIALLRLNSTELNDTLGLIPTFTARNSIPGRHLPFVPLFSPDSDQSQSL